MWCKTCQQDTPGVAQPATGRIVCSRCQQPVRTKKAVSHPRICDDGIALDEQTAPKVAAATATPFRRDPFPIQQSLRSLARELKRPSIVMSKSAAATSSDRPVDPPQDLVAQFNQNVAPRVTSDSTLPGVGASPPPRSSEGSQLIAWLIVVVGALVLTAGVGLIAWSLATKIMIFWNLALGLALGGQGTLILGLILVVSRLWRHSRYAAVKLQDVHARLGHLQQTAEILTTMRAGGAPAFYADLARGASPHVLLANLKGQLDQLATRVGTV
jgi:hypothetical protein